MAYEKFNANKNWKTLCIQSSYTFGTKYRRKVFSQKSLNILSIIFENVCQKFESTLVEFDGEKDHVHLLIHYPPKIALSKLVNALKGVSSRLLRKHVKEIHRYYWKGVLWSPSYFASSCGGAPLSVIKDYIQIRIHPANPKSTKPHAFHHRAEARCFSARSDKLSDYNNCLLTHDDRRINLCNWPNK